MTRTQRIIPRRSSNMSNSSSPVLIIGGSGVVGSATARTLRRLHPELPIALGGRDLAKAEGVAATIEGATAVAIDLNRPDLGLPAEPPTVRSRFSSKTRR